MQTSSLTIIKLFLLYLLVNKKNAKKKGIKKKTMCGVEKRSSLELIPD